MGVWHKISIPQVVRFRNRSSMMPRRKVGGIMLYVLSRILAYLDGPRRHNT